MGDPVLLDEIWGGIQSTSFLMIVNCHWVWGWSKVRPKRPQDDVGNNVTVMCVPWVQIFFLWIWQSDMVHIKSGWAFPSIVCLDGFSKVEASTWTIHHTPFTIRISIHDMMFPPTLDGWIFWGATKQSLRKLQHLLRGSKSLSAWKVLVFVIPFTVYLESNMCFLHGGVDLQFLWLEFSEIWVN